jgi:uncharacterized cupredoxin-like copper-binding protein
MVVSVPAGYTVHVNVTNKSSLAHSAVITAFSERTGSSGIKPVFRGASTPNPASGTARGTTVHFNFVPNKAGKYAIVCAVPGHAAGGMWDVFMVTKGGKPSIHL